MFHKFYYILFLYLINGNRRVGTGPSEKVVQEKTMWDEDCLDGISVLEAEEDISSSKESMHSSHPESENNRCNWNPGEHSP